MTNQKFKVMVSGIKNEKTGTFFSFQKFKIKNGQYSKRFINYLNKMEPLQLNQVMVKYNISFNEINNMIPPNNRTYIYDITTKKFYNKKRFFKANKQALLKEYGVKSIRTYKKQNNLTNLTDEEVYDILFERYNFERTNPFINLEDIYGLESKNKKQKLNIEKIEALKGFSNRLSISNSNNILGVKGLNLMYEFIPSLNSLLKSLKSLKINFNIKAQFELSNSSSLEKVGDGVFYFNSFLEVIANKTQIKKTLYKSIHSIINNIEKVQLRGSGWKLVQILDISLNANKYNPIKGSSYIELPKIIRDKNAVINIKNKDDKCFMYSVLCGLYHGQIKKDLNRPTKYKTYINNLNYEGIDFPVKIKDITKFERRNNLNINVYGLDEKNKPYVLQVSKNSFEKVIDLLLICNENKQHYTYIKSFSRFMSNSNDTRNKNYYCKKCLTSYRKEDKLIEHNKYDCGETLTQLPKFRKVDETFIKPTMKFKNYKHKLKNPFRIYADFESIIEKYDTSENKGLKDKHKVMSYGFNLVSDYDFEFCKYYSFVSDNETSVINHFIETLLKLQDKIEKVIDNNNPMVITKKQEEEFKIAKKCMICDLELNDDRVRDHDHISGLYRGACHSNCNINFNLKNYKIPVIFHNLKNYDAHLIISNLNNKNFSNMGIIAQNYEKFMTFNFSKLKFIDSCNFLSSSLDNLSNNLERGDKKHTLHSLIEYNIEEQDLLLKKGVYPYDYIGNFNILSEKKLPSKSKFYNKLYECDITDEEYKHALKVWNTFKCNTLMDYHNLYLKTDVLLLTDIFETFINLSINDYKLDPSYYISLPSFAWDVMMHMTKIEFDQLTDVDKYIFFEKQKRGGLSMITKKQGITKKASSKQELNSVIKYLDANNLYGLAMVQKLPYQHFKWCSFDYDISTFDFTEEIGYTFEVDLEYPKELHDLHNDYPLTMVKKKILWEELSENVKQKYIISKQKYTPTEKLIPTFKTDDLKNYVLDGRYLQFLVHHGVKINKIHRVMSYKQKAFLEPYIKFNTIKRTASKNDFEKDFYKLMNNAIFGKTMENVRGRCSIQAIMNEEELIKKVRQPYFKGNHIINKDLVLVEMNKRKVVLDKPLYVGASILDLSKIHMFGFWYDTLKPKFKENIKLLFTDTDSVCFELKTKYSWEHYIPELKNQLDLSNLKGEYYDGSNKKVLGKFKCETEGKSIKEFIGLRPKMYSLSLEDNKEKLTAKGVKKHKIKNELKHEHYRNCLLNYKDKHISYHTIQSKNHKIGTYKINKVALTHCDDKRFWINDIESRTYGHYKNN